jgi:hypothetical protein
MALTPKRKMNETSLAALPWGAVYHSPGKRLGCGEQPCGHPALNGRATNRTLLLPIDWPARLGQELGNGDGF